MKMGFIIQSSYTKSFGAVSFCQLQKWKNYTALGSQVKLLTLLNLSLEFFTTEALIFSLVVYQVTTIFNNHYKKKIDIHNCQTVNNYMQKASSYYTTEPIENIPQQSYNNDFTVRVGMPSGNWAIQYP